MSRSKGGLENVNVKNYLQKLFYYFFTIRPLYLSSTTSIIITWKIDWIKRIRDASQIFPIAIYFFSIYKQCHIFYDRHKVSSRHWTKIFISSLFLVNYHVLSFVSVMTFLVHLCWTRILLFHYLIKGWNARPLNTNA